MILKFISSIFYIKKGYNVICSYDEEKDTYIDLKSELKPDILLLDEPFSALDYQTRIAVADDVFKIILDED